jgi:hypothetical protein
MDILTGVFNFIVSSLFSIENGMGRVTIPVLAGYSFAEAIKRLAKQRGINDPMIPWGVSILVGAVFAWPIYDPTWVLPQFLGVMLIAISTPTIHSIILAILGLWEKTKPLAKMLSGETKNINPDSLYVEERICPEKNTPESVVKGYDENSQRDVTISKKSVKK